MFTVGWCVVRSADQGHNSLDSNTDCETELRQEKVLTYIRVAVALVVLPLKLCQSIVSQSRNIRWLHCSVQGQSIGQKAVNMHVEIPQKGFETSTIGCTVLFKVKTWVKGREYAC